MEESGRDRQIEGGAEQRHHGRAVRVSEQWGDCGLRGGGARRQRAESAGRDGSDGIGNGCAGGAGVELAAKASRIP